MNLAGPLHSFLRATARPGSAAGLLRAASGGLQHYANGTTAARVGALRVAFPAVAALLGDTPFQALASSFARATPARDWDLNAYGSELPDWIAAQQRDADGAALADVARIDWAMHRAAFADDRPPLDGAALAVAAAEQPTPLRLLAHPATALLRSEYPVASLWRSARDDTMSAPAGTAQSVLVGRQGGEVGEDTGDERVWMRPVQPGEAAFVAALLAGRCLAEAVAAAGAAEAGFDFGTTIARQLADRVWWHFTFAVAEPAGTDAE